MHVSFVNPPYLKNFSRPQRSPAVTKSGTLYYPMWLSYAAAYTEAGGYEIDLIDAPAEDLSDAAVLSRIRNSVSELIVVEASTPSIYNDVKFCDLLKEGCPDAFIVLVGTHVSALPEESLGLSLSVDAVAIGEYDETVRDLADALRSKKNLETVYGLCFRNEQTAIYSKNKNSRKQLNNLDDIPFVSRIYKRFLNPNNYFNPNALFPMVTITTGRGCPHKCIFCVYPQTMMGHKLRNRSIDNVVDEIQYIISAFPDVKAVFFEDDTFPANKKRCIGICEEIIRRKLSISWTANARVDLDKETMAVMKKAGCRCLCVGFESGNQQLLDNIKKGITLGQSRAFMQAAAETGILIHGCFIVGLPGETRETMEETLRFAISLRPDAIQIYPVMVYPGTEAFRWYDSKKLIKSKDFSKWLTPAGLHNTVIHGESLSAEELVDFCDAARKRFYLRGGYIWYKLKQMLMHPEEIPKTFKSARTFFKYLLLGSDVRKE